MAPPARILTRQRARISRFRDAHPNLRTAVRLLHSWTGGLGRSPAICWRRVDFIGIVKALALADFELSGVRDRGHGRALLAGIFLRRQFSRGKKRDSRWRLCSNACL